VGETTFNGVTSDVDVPFKDLLKNLDFGAAAIVEHRRNNWSFIGDLSYADISAGSTPVSNGAITLSLDANIKQLITAGYVGYRVFEKNYGNSSLGIDVLGGVRYNSIDVKLDIAAAGLGLAA